MRPYVIINAAMSADGKISTKEHRQTKISGDQDFARVDRLRADCDAVMVGIGTILADDSSLRLKNPDLIAERAAAGKPEQPMRVVIDSQARMPPDGDMFKKGTGQRVIFVAKSAPADRIAALAKKATVITAGTNKVDLTMVLDKLGEMGVRKLMVEGGATLLWSFTSQRLFDEIRIYVGALIIGGADAPTFVDGFGFTRSEGFTRLTLKDVEKIDDGLLITWLKKE
ncbi:MAG TPA: 2,5-diamino-6-(ribosylamino)-4(3H)-pyrimidinone 5'-phosphate reductase [Methanocorpusculum sp.]|nr:2,5-diamino-6-(ribosylamino)-4(3H)-pyrimidinone 5'-phosphate reductase [Methanocorpusculum sp.]HJK53243.1 2,5-diamino-6-(ribosylamino)-4(3H)-pyrimidinone 5'-phosphate reductase [Methanocorpusculum sp.]HJK69632.1 2,5-diamino-6-(ribosylamino)-4(3H)-pyrimidinone 5'-phosphate reductase [Methanocorpusculum sp.]HJK74040.1 2,5-diamino-6-(ribosylamino)-4(3H)-pyrimidinone 5'-phosphate reductase [Methanocorpusculum sp.]